MQHMNGDRWTVGLVKRLRVACCHSELLAVVNWDNHDAGKLGTIFMETLGDALIANYDLEDKEYLADLGLIQRELEGRIDIRNFISLNDFAFFRDKVDTHYELKKHFQDNSDLYDEVYCLPDVNIELMGKVLAQR